ncbi:hypothetical protein cypCar_00021164 [Cyprinus carpio]|nr:hypothetical protein cypCar_00021164 [Cyprinus carpio]
MGDIEAPDNNRSRQTIFHSLLPSKEFITSRKGLLLLGEVVMSFISFVCFAASTAAAFVTAPLIEFLAALFLLFAYSTKFNERFKGFHWPLMVSFLTYRITVLELHRAFVHEYQFCAFSSNHHACCFIKDFLRCVSASIIFFIISIISVSKYVDGASKAAGVFGFITTIFFALDFYFIFNELADFLKGGDSSEEPPNTQEALSSRITHSSSSQMMTQTPTLTKAVIVSKNLVCDHYSA